MLFPCTIPHTQVLHQHFVVDSPSKVVMDTLASAQAKVNQLWKDALLPKFIQWGRDGQGAHSHALNGLAAKAVLRHLSLIVDSIKEMTPVYALMECNQYELGQKLSR